jgi:peptide chain release factor 1
MSAIPREKLDRLVGQWTAIQAELNDGPDPTKYASLSKEFSDLDPIVAVIKDLEEAEQEHADLRSLIEDPAGDEDMAELAREEVVEVSGRLATLARELSVLLLPKDAADDKSAIMEIRAGTGGDEAALFAADLFRMYQRYADLKRWKTEVISVSENNVGGYKEIIASITGKGAFARLKFESGVHRVQRIPSTETSGRIHTSAATVAVLPEAEDIDIEIKSEDLRIDTMRASGAGGQHVNTTDSAVRITHIPSGIVVLSAEKSQHQNRAQAMQVLRSRLYDTQRQKAASERAEQRRDQIGSGDRSQRIRTYNFPQARITDHRVNLTLHKLEQVLAGEALDEIVDTLITQHQANLLAQIDGEADA